jgi:hypothetical protein
MGRALRETHQLRELRLMGIAALHPSYELRLSQPDLANRVIGTLAEHDVGARACR